MTSPLLWYLNRGTGVVLLVVFTATVVLGVLATGRSATPLWPRFVTQGLHRSLAALSVFMLAAHVMSAVVDSFVDIRWWQSFVPFGATYEPLWLAMGAIALDLIAVVVATSLARSRVPHKVWLVVHLSTYAAWVSAVVHGIFIGTDSAEGWMVSVYIGCVAAVGLAVLARLVAVAHGTWVGRRTHTATALGRRPVSTDGSARHGSPDPVGARSGGGAS
jgi:methionine sulfoxide reductase heme-binding subunit